MTDFSIPAAPGDIQATLYEPATPRSTLVLAHGAGAGRRHPWMRARAGDLADRGIRVITFDFPYITTGRRLPDRQPVLLDAWRRVIAAIRDGHPDQPLVIGGKSMGGRMATMVVSGQDAAPGVRGCVALGYPLHPPGKPDQLRVAHLGDVRVPLLVIQGERDPFGGPDEIAREFTRAGSHPLVVPVPGGGHGFEVPARTGRQGDVFTRVADAVVQWLDTLQPADSR